MCSISPHRSIRNKIKASQQVLRMRIHPRASEARCNTQFEQGCTSWELEAVCRNRRLSGRSSSDRDCSLDSMGRRWRNQRRHSGTSKKQWLRVALSAQWSLRIRERQSSIVHPARMLPSDLHVWIPLGHVQRTVAMAGIAGAAHMSLAGSTRIFRLDKMRFASSMKFRFSSA